MTPSERERIAAYLTETRENLLRTARNLSPTQLQYKPAPDRWSVAECLEHIVVVETLILDNINNTLQQAAGSSASSFGDDGLRQIVVDRSTRVKGPERLMPTGRWPHEQLARRIRGGSQTHGRFRHRYKRPAPGIRVSTPDVRPARLLPVAPLGWRARRTPPGAGRRSHGRRGLPARLRGALTPFLEIPYRCGTARPQRAHERFLSLRPVAPRPCQGGK